MDSHHLSVAALGQGGHHLLAHLASADVSTNTDDGARDVPAHDQGQGSTGGGAAIAPIPPEQVATIHRGGLDAYKHLTGQGFGVGNVLVAEYVLGAQLVNDCGLQLVSFLQGIQGTYRGLLRLGFCALRFLVFGTAQLAKRCRRTFLSNLPTAVLGISSMNTTSSGSHQWANLPSKWASTSSRLSESFCS